MDPGTIITGVMQVLTALWPVVQQALEGGRTPSEIAAAARAAVMAIRANPVSDAVADAIAEHVKSAPAIAAPFDIDHVLSNPELLHALRERGWRKP